MIIIIIIIIIKIIKIIIITIVIVIIGTVSKRRPGPQRREAIKRCRNNPYVFLSIYLLRFHYLFLFSLKFNRLERLFLTEKIEISS